MFVNKDLRFIDEIDELSAMPSIAMDLMALLNEPSSGVKEIVAKIKMDAALTAFVLKYCNSPLLGFKNEINSITHAVNLIGYARCKSILMSYFIRNLYVISGKRYITNYLWEHSLSVAIIARELALRILPDKKDEEEAEEVYVAGLLHDIGKLVLFYHDPKYYEQLMHEADKNRTFYLPLEKQSYGYTHVDTGYYLLNKWGLSETLKNAVNCHHDFFGCNEKSNHAGLVSFANITVHFAIEKRDIFPLDFLEYYRLTEDNYQEIIEVIYYLLAETHLIHLQ